MSGKNVAVYLNGELLKYYQFYQIYDYNFLGFNGNDPVDYIKFDSAEINENEIRLNRKEEKPKLQRYKVTILTTDGGYVFYSNPMENMKEAVLSLVKQFEREMEKDNVLSVEFEIFGESDPEWKNMSPENQNAV